MVRWGIDKVSLGGDVVTGVECDEVVGYVFSLYVNDVYRRKYIATAMKHILRNVKVNNRYF